MFKRQDAENQWDRHPIGRSPDIPPIIPHLTPIERVCIPPERTVLDYDFLKLLAFSGLIEDSCLMLDILPNFIATVYVVKKTYGWLEGKSIRLLIFRN